jgi:hypothetical protein
LGLGSQSMGRSCENRDFGPAATEVVLARR